jgi:hypothetical protein
MAAQAAAIHLGLGMHFMSTAYSYQTPLVATIKIKVSKKAKVLVTLKVITEC